MNLDQQHDRSSCAFTTSFRTEDEDAPSLASRTGGGTLLNSSITSATSTSSAIARSNTAHVCTLSSSSTTTTSHLGYRLSWDNITEILLWSDMDTAIQLANCVTTTPSKAFATVWKAMLQRQRFPIIINDAMSVFDDGNCCHCIDYIQELLYRRLLLSNIIGNGCRRRRKSNNSLSLPATCYSFLPIRPESNLHHDDGEDVYHPMDMNEDEDDPPPVDFNFSGDPCLLVHPTKPECVLYNPFTGQLSYCSNVLQRSLQSQDFVSQPEQRSNAWLLEQQQSTVQQPVARRNGSVTSAETGQHEATAALLLLCDGLKYIRPSEYGLYFTEEIQERIIDAHYDVDVVPLGMEMTSYYSHNQASLLQVAFGRSIHLVTNDDNNNNDDDSNNFVVTEIQTWERPIENNQSHHQWKRHGMLRFRHEFFAIEWDGTHQVCYVNPESQLSTNRWGSTKILVYPVVMNCDNSDSKNCICCSNGKNNHCSSSSSSSISLANQCPTQLRFERNNGTQAWMASDTYPLPLVTIDCGESVTNLACLGGIVLVGIASCQLQLYQNYQLVNTLDVAKCVRTSMSRCRGTTTSSVIPFPVAPITEIQVPAHLASSHETFVTMHHDDFTGTVLLVWMLDSTTQKLTYQIESIVQLPLIHRRPCMYYDGRRLIVYGQDHIGYIVLIYVVGTGDDDPTLGPNNNHNDGSGGVLVSSTSSSPHGLRFVRRIRHAALGGHLIFERLILTCNERFLIFNTKLGHSLVEGGGTDGLLVIDLEQADDTTSSCTTML